ncbi:MAG: broad specificity phosphatase PhoE [Candidatus Paceibacteria bacterium]|jgi:probable phosphoglycerate mutase
MKVIFIRHGQTDENVAGRHQPTFTPLSLTGRKQAVAAGQRLVETGITHIVASPLIRTLQTSSLIANQLDMIPSIDHSLVELIRPTTLTGYGHNHWRSMVFYLRWYVGLTKTGETYAQLRERIVTATTNLERLPDDAVVLVVTHSVFMSLLVSHVCYDRALSPWAIVRTFIRLKRLKNTQMIEYTVSKGENLCGWTQTQGELSL